MDGALTLAVRLDSYGLDGSGTYRDPTVMVGWASPHTSVSESCAYGTRGYFMQFASGRKYSKRTAANPNANANGDPAWGTPHCHCHCATILCRFG